MTIFGWDASHYDGTLTKTIMAKARAEGISFFTHKLGEGLSAPDATQGTALAAARDAGIPVLGGYWFLHGNNDAGDAARACIATADKYEPWWRKHPAWFWQADAETSPTGLPAARYVVQFCDELAHLSGREVIAYASHSMYRDSLTGLGHPLWNANYPTSRTAPFGDIYPGDSFGGWTPYSGQAPAILQYTSSATIAGLSTCDANAYRGTLASFMSLIGADVAATTATPVTIDTASVTAIVKAVLAAPIYARPAGEQTDATMSLAWAARGAYIRSGAASNVELPALTKTVAGLQTQVSALQTQIATLQQTVSAALVAFTK